jgi:post-segregation antitoxin (ccd killing protein)
MTATDVSQALQTAIALDEQRQETAKWKAIAEARSEQIRQLRERVLQVASGERCRRCALADEEARS